MDRGAWRATERLAQSQTQLKRLSTHNSHKLNIGGEKIDTNDPFSMISII